YLTAVTRVDDKLVEIIDVEKILAETVPSRIEVERPISAEVQARAMSKTVLVVDDSSVARKQILRCLAAVGAEAEALNDGLQALEYLRQMLDEGRRPAEELLMVVSVVEMPAMDGYTLAGEIRQGPRLQGLHVLLPTSLPGVFNLAMVQKVGADDFLCKFRPAELADRVIARIEAQG